MEERWKQDTKGIEGLTKLNYVNLADNENVIVGCPLDQQLNVEEHLGSYNVVFADEGYSYDITDYSTFE